MKKSKSQERKLKAFMKTMGEKNSRKKKKQVLQREKQGGVSRDIPTATEREPKFHQWQYYFLSKDDKLAYEKSKSKRKAKK